MGGSPLSRRSPLSLSPGDPNQLPKYLLMAASERAFPGKRQAPRCLLELVTVGTSVSLAATLVEHEDRD
jgi:hypothetical protein